MDMFDIEIEEIENKPNLTIEEKNRAIQEVERDARAAYEEERQAAHDEIDRRYEGF